MAQANVEIANYNSLLAVYSSTKTAYETAIASNKARVGDINKILFETPIAVPNRPCAPTKPAAYTGPQIDWTAAAGATDVTTPLTMKPLRKGRLARTAPGSSINAGFVRVSNDTTVPTVANTIMYAGHTFGLYGQGNDTMPADGIAFEYTDKHGAASTDVHSMMISMFPYDGTQTTGLGATENITMKASIVTWRTNTDLSVPTTLTDPVALTTLGASYLFAGASALAAVAISLY